MLALATSPGEIRKKLDQTDCTSSVPPDWSKDAHIDGQADVKAPSQHQPIRQEERMKRVKESFEDIENKESLHQSLIEAMNCLQPMLQPLAPANQFVDDPENEPALGPTKPFLAPSPCWPGAFVLPFSDSLASKQIFHRRWLVLPSKLANVTYSDTTLPLLLTSLNTIFETNFKMTPDVEACLTEFIDDGCDLGQIYGYLRPWMDDVHDEDQSSRLTDLLHKRREEDFALRSEAMNSNRINNPRVPPRRVWDLYANRVLPYHALAPDPRNPNGMPLDLWAVSHSWVAPSARQSVLTTINGKSWRVPIPSGTTLDSIRNELLALGAEYVFLDVLCLRQQDEHLPDFESIRKREWRLDVPTIGHIYNEHTDRPVIIYFNGLGLPFHDSPADPGDRFHWFNRVWTLQETPEVAIIGGLGGMSRPFNISHTRKRAPPGVNAALFWSLCRARDVCHSFDKALDTITSRTYTNPVDQVACLAYLLHCESLPIYDADIDVEIAWNLLVECLPDETRTQLLFSDFGPRKKSGSWCPTWAQLIGNARFRWPYRVTKDEQLKHLDVSSPELGYRHDFDAYYHKPYVIDGCRIDICEDDRSRGATVTLPCFSGGFQTFKVSEWGESIERDVEYMLIGVGWLQYWVVAQVEGVRRIGAERAVEVSKVSTVTIPDSGVWASLQLFKDVVKSHNCLVVYH